MYGHLKSLTRMGDGAGDAPTGTSMGFDRSVKGVVAATGWGAKGTDILKNQPESAIQTAARENALKTKATGMANVHGFAHKSTGSALHTGASSFQHQKGVVNTLGGVRDITREEKDRGLPPKGEKRPQVTIATIGSLDTWAAEGKAKKEAAMAKIAAAGKAPSLGGDGGGGGVHTINDKPARRHQPNLPPAAGGIATIHAPSRGPIRPSAVVSSGGGSARSGPAMVLSGGGAIGGGGGGAVLGGTSGNGGMTDAEKRVAYLEKRMAEAKAKLAAGE